jgi:hypothetical protein
MGETVFVITADQVGSRSGPDLAAAALDDLNERYRPRLTLPVDRNAGDEIQALTADSRAAVDLVLDLTRTGKWSVGLGCGSVRTPLPDETREASGDAFIAARAAVTRAKRTATRFAASAVHDPQAAEDAEAILNLLLTIRSGRSAAGWELFDLVSSGLTQAEAGKRLGITPQSASDRARAGGIRVELASIGPLTRLLASLDDAQHRTETA